MDRKRKGKQIGMFADKRSLEVKLDTRTNTENGFDPWRSANLFVGKRFASRHSLYALIARLCASANETAKQ